MEDEDDDDDCIVIFKYGNVCQKRVFKLFFLWDMDTNLMSNICFSRIKLY